MIVLCPNCHDEASRSAITEIEQREYKAAPFNIQRGFSMGQLVCRQKFCAVEVGQCLLVNDGPLLSVDNSVLLALSLDENYRLAVPVELNDRDDTALALIEKNEWISGDPGLWDLEFSYRQLRIRHANGDIALHVDARADVLQLRAKLWKRGQLIELDPKWIRIDGALKDNRYIHLTLVGLRIDVSSKEAVVRWVPDERYGSGKS